MRGVRCNTFNFQNYGVLNNLANSRNSTTVQVLLQQPIRRYKGRKTWKDLFIVPLTERLLQFPQSSQLILQRVSTRIMPHHLKKLR